MAADDIVIRLVNRMHCVEPTTDYFAVILYPNVRYPYALAFICPVCKPDPGVIGTPVNRPELLGPTLDGHSSQERYSAM